MVPSQTGRFSRAFVPSGFVGQGGFGRVYRAVHTQQQHACAVKVIPAKLRQGETIEQKDDVWSGGAVFEKLRIMSAPNVVRYYDYWLEEINPLAPETGAQAAAAAANLQVPCMPQAAMVAEDDGDSPWDSMSPRSPWSSASLDSVSNPDGFEWEQSDEAEECLDDAPGGNPHAAAGSLPQAAVAADAEDMFLLVSMEFCDGITLHEWLFDPEKPTGGKKAKSTPMEDALDLARQLLQGLSDLHEASIVHRDIKPANLLIESSSGRLRIFDFGLSRLTSSSVSSPTSGASPLPTPAVPTPQRSNRGLVVGSPGYLAPEQGEAAAAHPSADVFSAGVVLVELFIAAARRAHGRPVWETAMERANAIRSLHEPDACPPPEELDALPTQLRTLLSLMTHPDASTRPTAAEALELIQQPVL